MQDFSIILDKYARHIPKLLRYQIVDQLTEVFIQRAKTINRSLGIKELETSANYLFEDHELCSIRRFYGVVLFIDISGFTRLSQKLTVDELKSQINLYFTKIINIILKHHGHIVKFAGDALLVVWNAKLASLGTPTELSLDSHKPISLTRFSSHSILPLIHFPSPLHSIGRIRSVTLFSSSFCGAESGSVRTRGH